MVSNKRDISNIKINNFGIIKYADIDISPFTVLIGPNSCGKSFAAKLIHCLSLTPDEDISKIGLKHVSDSFNSLIENNSQVFELIDEINNYLKTNPSIKSEPLKIPIEKLDSIVDEGIVGYLSEILSEMIVNQFEEELDDLINFNEDFFKIKIRDNELYKKIGEKFVLNVNNIVMIEDEEPKDKGRLLMSVFTDDENVVFNMESILLNENNLDDFSIFALLYQTIGLSIFENILLENSFYIPAERSDLIIDRKLLTRKILDKSDTSKNQSEVLVNILNIDPSKKSIFYDIACELEAEFSDISVGIDDSNIFNSVSYMNSQTNDIVSSRLLSTSIHEMSIFILYLKYVLNEGDLLIIEEPEAHLHPANQRLLVKYFVKAINNGLKILITTHSDYIISQIDNMINLNSIPKEKLNDLNYVAEDILDFKDISIYNFKKNSNGSFNSEKIIINEDGFIEDNFSKIADELYDETIFIRNLSS